MLVVGGGVLPPRSPLFASCVPSDIKGTDIYIYIAQPGGFDINENDAGDFPGC